MREFLPQVTTTEFHLPSQRNVAALDKKERAPARFEDGTVWIYAGVFTFRYVNYALVPSNLIMTPVLAPVATASRLILPRGTNAYFSTGESLLAR